MLVDESDNYGLGDCDGDGDDEDDEDDTLLNRQTKRLSV